MRGCAEHTDADEARSGSEERAQYTRTMSARVIASTSAIAVAVTLWVVWPRFGHPFPSLVDDWSAIADSPAQIRSALTLGSPEPGRYRPGWIVWNYLQWHTFGGPDDLRPARIWGLLRVLSLPLGLLAAALVCVSARRSSHSLGRVWPAALALTATLAVVTVPGFAVDLARYGPQEPLLVGLACAGAALIAVTGQRVVHDRTEAGTIVLGIGGLLLWTAGVAQKESSICLLVLLPFLVLQAVPERDRWRTLRPRGRVVLLGLTAGTLGALAPMLVRTLAASRRDDLVYGAEPGSRVREQLVTALRLMTTVTGSTTVAAILLAAGLALGVGLALDVGIARRRPDWLGLGLLSTALAFLLFSSQTGVVVSRYYLPFAACAALALCRSVTSLPRPAVGGTVVLLTLAVVLQLPDARDDVNRWLEGENVQETLVRSAAAIEAAGCPVGITGPDIEFVAAFPVLLRFAHEAPARCSRGATYLAILTGSSRETGDEPLVRRCASPTPVVETRLGRIVRCAER